MTRHRVTDVQTLKVSPFLAKSRKIDFVANGNMKLKSAVVHLGGNTLARGHYITYIFLEDGDVLIMDDLDRKIIRKKQLSEQDIEKLERGSYLLFYQAPISL